MSWKDFSQVLIDIELKLTEEQLTQIQYKYIDCKKVDGLLNFDELLKDVSEFLSSKSGKVARPQTATKKQAKLSNKNASKEDEQTKS